MSKINADHLARGAYVYVRQSTADQLKHNHESRRRQYALADRARTLGWTEVVVIDDDLGPWEKGHLHRLHAREPHPYKSDPHQASFYDTVVLGVWLWRHVSRGFQ